MLLGRVSKYGLPMGVRGKIFSSLEVFLDNPRIGFAETLLDPRVVQHVIKTYPGFYTKYPTAKAVEAYKPVWRAWSMR